ncbi:MAG: hypothetical protein IJF72_03675 [Clostridia bacterium]|nr:hypothetical protein [Clostridia bacterium]
MVVFKLCQGRAVHLFKVNIHFLVCGVGGIDNVVNCVFATVFVIKVDVNHGVAPFENYFQSCDGNLYCDAYAVCRCK